MRTLAALTTSVWCSKLLAGSCCPQATFCSLLEHVMKLPFFGYTTFVVERINDDTVPVPCFFGVNKEEIIVVDGSTQVCQTISPDVCHTPTLTFRRTCAGRGWTSLHHSHSDNSTGPKQESVEQSLQPWALLKSSVHANKHKPQ